ncbi:sugar phosphate isomerase/epimerase [Candidatus Poribacteria bacterium]|nr:sugar phosphate isomerase/epimerase [Candidatus Poribacteria bacterium]MYB63374.1 sugar phosphate isomerase/epimerase [Candidatus Poribacteria bacterium]MYF54716.1 sugar phosphate isomerase/epimerase [Candidatus Poribacteria bacterium]MYI93796.1 sugar phosphate isomerase/epimerase [Candidatus Poribacteria bacterium]
MKLGFVSAILPDQTLEAVIQFAAETGYDCVELMCWPKGKAERRYAGVTHIDVMNISDADVDRILQCTSDAGVMMSGLGYYPNPLTPNETEAEIYSEHLKQLILAAKRLSVDIVNTFIGRDQTRTIDANWQRFKDVWKPLIQFAEDNGIRIGIENCPMFFTEDEWPSGQNLAYSPAIWERMFAEIPSNNFGLNFDPSHFIWLQMDYLKPLATFADRIFHVHAKDVRLDRERLNEVGILATPLQYHTPKLPGLGDVDWGRFFSVLSDTGYEGSVCVEVEDRAYEATLETRRRALRQSHLFLRQFIG